jgi:hypothetical protein
MKTYVLRNTTRVEPQILPSRATATAAVPNGSVLFLGLDVHNDSIAVSIAPGDSTKVRRYGIIGGTHDDVLKLCKKLQAAHPGTVCSFVTRRGVADADDPGRTHP